MSCSRQCYESAGVRVHGCGAAHSASCGRCGGSNPTPPACKTAPPERCANRRRPQLPSHCADERKARSYRLFPSSRRLARLCIGRGLDWRRLASALDSPRGCSSRRGEFDLTSTLRPCGPSSHCRDRSTAINQQHRERRGCRGASCGGFRRAAGSTGSRPGLRPLTAMPRRCVRVTDAYRWWTPQWLQPLHSRMQSVGSPDAVRSRRQITAAGSGVHRNASSSACDGVFQPSVCRGRPLSSFATSSRSAWV